MFSARPAQCSHRAGGSTCMKRASTMACGSWESTSSWTCAKAGPRSAGSGGKGMCAKSTPWAAATGARSGWLPITADTVAASSPSVMRPSRSCRQCASLETSSTTRLGSQESESLQSTSGPNSAATVAKRVRNSASEQVMDEASTTCRVKNQPAPASAWYAASVIEPPASNRKVEMRAPMPVRSRQPRESTKRRSSMGTVSQARSDRGPRDREHAVALPSTVALYGKTIGLQELNGAAPAGTWAKGGVRGGGRPAVVRCDEQLVHGLAGHVAMDQRLGQPRREIRGLLHVEGVPGQCERLRTSG